MTVSISKLEELRSTNTIERLLVEHNAVPVLLEVAKAALAYIAVIDGDAIGNAYHRARSAANDALRAALAKVAP